MQGKCVKQILIHINSRCDATDIHKCNASNIFKLTTSPLRFNILYYIQCNLFSEGRLAAKVEDDSGEEEEADEEVSELR